MIGSKLGGELTIAAKTGIQQNATIILGDRLYGVTIQRIFDKLKFYERLKIIFVLIFEVITMSFFKLKEYIKRSEDDIGFIKNEIDTFSKHLPVVAKVCLFCCFVLLVVLLITIVIINVFYIFILFNVFLYFTCFLF